jgi:hypothetical protein
MGIFITFVRRELLAVQGLPRNPNVLPIHDSIYRLRCRCPRAITNLFWSNIVSGIRVKTG